jgi:hypothetical protein
MFNFSAFFHETWTLALGSQHLFLDQSSYWRIITKLYFKDAVFSVRRSIILSQLNIFFWGFIVSWLPCILSWMTWPRIHHLAIPWCSMLFTAREVRGEHKRQQEISWQFKNVSDRRGIESSHFLSHHMAFSSPILVSALSLCPPTRAPQVSK